MPVVSVGQLTITDVNDGLSLVLTNVSHNVPTDSAGNSPVFTGAVSTARVLAGGTNVTSEWTISAVSSVGLTGTFTNNTYTVTAMTTDVGTVDFTATKIGSSDLTARFTVTKSKKGDTGTPGLNGITIVLSNEAHTLPANSSGAVSSYANSGTTIRVFEGNTELNAVSGATSNGSFGIGTPTQLPASTITVGAITYSSKTASVANHSAMVNSTDSVVISYPITIKRSNGATITVTKTQTITKSKQGSTGGTGPTGPRGTVHLFKQISGDVWSDSEASNLFITGQPYSPVIIADRVTLFNNSRSFSQTRAWTGTAWEIQSEVIDGNLLVTKSITADKININDLFAQTITLPDTGVIRAGTTTYAQMGGAEAFFTARDGDQTIFMIGRGGQHFINGRHIQRTLPPEAFDNTVLPWIRSQLAISAPSAGGSAGGDGTMGLTGLTITTTTAIPSAGASVPASVGVSYGGMIDYIVTSSNPSAVPTIAVQLQRIVNDGTPVNISTVYNFSGSATKGEKINATQWEWTISIPTFSINYSDSSPGSGNIKYRAVITLSNPFTPNVSNLGAVNLSASQAASGGISGTVSWSNILGVPNVALVGHAHSAADITTGTLSTARGGTGRTDGKVDALATPRTINGTNFDGSAAITTANWGTARTVTIGSTGKSVNGSGNVSWTHAELGTTRNFGTVYVQAVAGDGNITTAQFIGWLSGIGALQQPSVMKCSWDYAGNNNISDTGFGLLELAGCVIETFPDGGVHIIRVTSPSTGTGAGGIHEYVNQGPDYSPGWRRVYTSTLNGNVGGSSTSIAGYNNPTTGATPNTTAYRDSQGDISARLFKSNYPAEGYFPAGSALAFRSNNTSDDYIRFCSDPALIRNWIGSPSSAGVGAFGTWDVSITGNAGSALILAKQNNYSRNHSHLPADYVEGQQVFFVGPEPTQGGWQNYGTVINTRTFSGGGGSLQMYVPYGPSYGGTGLQVRFGDYSVSSGNSWTNWKTLLASDNFNAYAVDLISNQNIQGNKTLVGNTVIPNLSMLRQSYVNGGINWYSQAYTAWIDYMSPAGQTGCGPQGAVTAPSGVLVTTWALRRFIENAAGYGWTFESGGAQSGNPVVVAEIRSSDGSARFGGDVTAASFVGSGAGLNNLNAAGIGFGTLDDARLPSTFSQKAISRPILATGANDYHLELHSPSSGSSGGNIALRFHQGGQWYHSIRANSSGFRFTAGAGDALINLTAGAYNFGDNGGYMGAGAGGSMRVQTPTGYIDVGSQNTAYAHFQTDRPQYYFNKAIQVDGEIKIYNNNNVGINASGAYGNGSQLTNVNASLLSGYPTDNYLRFIGWSPRDANTQPNMDVNFTYSLNAPFAGPLIKMGPSGYELQLNAAYGNGSQIAFRTRNGDVNAWHSWREFASYESSNGYLYTKSWINIPNNNGIFWNNGTEFWSTGDGSLRLRTGGAGVVSIALASSGDVTRGFVYADSVSNIGFLNNTGSWSLRVTAQSYVYATRYYAISSIRYKNINRVASITESEQRVKALGQKGVSIGTYKKDPDGKLNRWLIAEDVEKVSPEVINYNEQGQPDSVDYTQLIPDLYAALASALHKIEQLERQVYGH